MIGFLQRQRFGLGAGVTVALLFTAVPEAMAQQGVAGPRWSPDGKSIVFSAQDDGDDYEIFIMRADGRNVRQLTKNDHTDIHPSFSGDGRTIYFAATQDRGEGRKRDWDIAKISSSGGAGERLFGEVGFTEYHRAELPDGRIAYSKRPTADPYDSDLFVWNPKTRQSTILIDLPAIRPKSGLFEIKVGAPQRGDRFLFNSRRNGHNEIFSAKLDGSGIEQLTAVFRVNPDGWLGNAAPSISADGRYFVVWTDQQAPKPETGGPEGYIVHKLYDRAMGQSRYLPKPDVKRFMAYPSLSPDGSKIAFAATVHVGGPAGPWAVFVQNVSSGEITELWRQPDGK